MLDVILLAVRLGLLRPVDRSTRSPATASKESPMLIEYILGGVVVAASSSI